MVLGVPGGDEEKWAQTTPPSNEPLTTSETKDHLRVDLDADDSLIDNLIVTARQKAEHFTRRVLITQTWEFYRNAFPTERYITIPKPPLDSVNSVKYTPDGSSETTFDSDKYRVDDKREPARIVLKEDEDWTSDNLIDVNGVVVNFDAGYGGQSDVPQQIKQAMLMMIGHWYENREDVGVNVNLLRMPLGAKNLLLAYKVQRYF